MNLYTPLAAVAALVGGIVFLRIFWTLWTVVENKIAGDKLHIMYVGKAVRVLALKDTPVHIRFNSGSTLEEVILMGYLDAHEDTHYELKEFLVFKSQVGKTYYVRISEIEYFEQVTASHE